MIKTDFPFSRHDLIHILHSYWIYLILKICSVENVYEKFIHEKCEKLYIRIMFLIVSYIVRNQ